MNKIILSVKHLHQSFGDNNVLYDINLEMVEGQFVALVSSSGCGKSTLLKAILGTDPPKSGKIVADEHIVSEPNRHVGIVYQHYGLYDFLTAEQNVAEGLKWDQTNIPFRSFLFLKWRKLRKQHLTKARELLTRFKLGHALHQYPCNLSGGMQQRVAIAQSLVMRPKILLLDEPFGALDESTREDLQQMLLELYAENLEAKKGGKNPPWTVIMVTHELNEAFYVSDRLIALSRNWYQDTKNGRIFGKDVGATKVWDKCTPTFSPNGPKNFDLFHHAKQELREAILDDEALVIERNQHVSYWEDLAQGVGTGVAMIKTDVMATNQT